METTDQTGNLAHQGYTLIATLITGTATGYVSLQEIDLRLAVGLKIVSYISFGVAIGYGIWKWRVDYLKNKKENDGRI